MTPIWIHGISGSERMTGELDCALTVGGGRVANVGPGTREGSGCPVLFDGRLAPLTFSVGFLDAPPEEVAAVLVEFFTRVHDGGRATELGGSFEENLLELPPLTIGSQPKVLLASTALDGWTAMFEGDALGQGVAQLTGLLASQLLKVRGYFVSSVPPAGNSGGPLGARQFRVLGPETKLGTVRTVDLIENNPGRWYFEAGGEVQPFEDVEAYGSRRRRDRFTEKMLVGYAAAVGLRPWDESFYRNPSYLVTNAATIRYPFTLGQARARLGLDG